MIDSKQITCVVCKSKSSCFEKLDLEELNLTTAHKAQVHYRKGEIINKQGTFISHILFLKDGYAKLYKETDKTTDIILDIIPPGELIGLSALYGDNISQFSVSALTDANICTIDRNLIEDLVKKNGEFAAQVIKTINHQNQMFYTKMVSISQKQMHGRVADALLYLSEHVFKSEKFNLPLSRKELAEFTGMSTMSFVRTLKDMQKSGIVDDKSAEGLHIKNLKKLQSLSQTG